MQYRGAIDCDIHPAVPDMRALLPYMDEYWREHLITRGTERLTLHMTSFPPNAPLCVRADYRPSAGLPGSDLAQLTAQALDAFGTRYAICNVIYAAQVMFNEDMAAVLCRAVNDWVAAEWLDRDPRLRASIMVPTQSPQQAAEEIERCAADPRFVQVLMLANTEMPAGRRYFWPIYEAAERLDLPIGLHAGSSYRFAPSNAGWPSYYHRGICLQCAGLQTGAPEPDHRGRISEVSRPQGRADRGRLHLAAGLLLAHRQDLARRAARGAVGEGRAVRDSFAGTSASPCSQPTRRPTRSRWSASSTRSAATI